MEPIPEIIQLKSIPSTNSYLKELLKQRNLAECSVVITHNQTRGRGQIGNSWESEPGKNLTFSVVFYPDIIPASHQFIFSKTISVALAAALEEFITPIDIKWPNDLYYQHQKLGGILIENSLEGNSISQSVVGIGINVNQTSFSAIVPNGISMKMISGKEWNLQTIFQKLHESLIKFYQELIEGNTTTIEEQYLSHLYRKSGYFKYRDKNGEFLATISAIEPSGHLCLKRPDQTISKYAFKEVEFIL